MSNSFLFTSESVSEGHPDKIADQISDAILDAIIVEDPKARVACETTVNTGLVLLSGEITTTAKVDYQTIARDTIREIGYTDPHLGFSADELVTRYTKKRPGLLQVFGSNMVFCTAEVERDL